MLKLKKILFEASITGQQARTESMGGFKGFFKFCFEQGWLLKSPIESIKQGRVDQVEPKILSVAESKKLIETARKLFGGETLAYFSLLLFAGLRPSEIHGGLLWNPKRANSKPLEWSEVTLDKKKPMITVLHTKGRVIRTMSLMPNCATLLNEVKDFPITFFLSKNHRTLTWY